jgi:hypothetical protein
MHHNYLDHCLLTQLIIVLYTAICLHFKIAILPCMFHLYPPQTADEKSVCIRMKLVTLCIHKSKQAIHNKFVTRFYIYCTNLIRFNNFTVTGFCKKFAADRGVRNNFCTLCLQFVLLKDSSFKLFCIRTIKLTCKL